MTFKVAAIGSRNHSCVQEVDIRLQYAKDMAERGGETMEVVTGTAPGVNERVIEWCRRVGVPCTVIPIDWDGLGEVAGSKANPKILEGVVGLFAFWDGRSENTLDAIVRGKKNKNIKVVVDVR
jgi:hypothetical protein